MPQLASPELEIQLDAASASGLIVDRREDQRQLGAQVRVACTVTFDEEVKPDERYHLTVDLYGVDDDDRQMLTPFYWGEITADGEARASRIVRFGPGTGAGERRIERICLVSQFLLDEDEATRTTTTYGIFDARQDDEIQAEFNLSRFGPDAPRGDVIATVAADTTVLI